MVANLFLPLFGGFLVDRMGPNRILVVTCFLVCLGQLLFSIGVEWKTYSLMLVGRILFGLGGETLAVTQSQITSEWFQSKELALGLGVNLSIGRLGSVLNDILSPYLGVRYSISAATWTGFGFCLLSMVCACFLARWNTKFTKKKKSVEEGSFPVGFVFLNGIIVFLYATMIPFNTIHAAFLQSKWYPNDPQTAGQIMAIPDTLSALLVPFVGTLVDTFGHRIKWLIASGSIMLTVHLYFAFATPQSPQPFVFLCLLGIAYSFLITCWSIIPLLVEKRTGTGFGIATTSLNISLVVFPIAVGYLQYDHTYLLVELFFVCMSLLGTLSGVILLYLDSRYQYNIETQPIVYKPIELDHLD
ncbi:major facilitator superfamily domain-containing protein [Gorgonomyces haynaldii]|nr:major facilitator superfamily domain-containing protein [Gorgonomyces haynaldii]